MNIKILPLLLIGAITFAGCEKDKDDLAPTTPGGGAQTGPANGLLMLDVGSFGPVLTQDAQAVFKQSNDSVNAGVVSINGIVLEWDTEYKIYANEEDNTALNQPTVNWSVSGGNGWPGFTTNAGGATLPVITGEITSPAQINLSNGYTLTVGGLTGADSTFFEINEIARGVAGNAVSMTFTPAQLQPLQGQQSFVAKVWGKKTVRQTHGGKTVDIVLMRTAYKFLTL